MSTENDQPSRVLDGLPHEPPMLWLDKVKDQEAVSYLDKHPLFDQSLQLGPHFLIEALAQTFGALALRKLIDGGAAPEDVKGFLMGIRNFQFCGKEEWQRFLDSTPEFVEARVISVRDINPVFIAEGKVLSDSGLTLAWGQLTLFGSSE